MKRVMTFYTRHVTEGVTTIPGKAQDRAFGVDSINFIDQIEDLLRKFPMACAVLINSFLFAIAYQVFAARFETNDDVGMMLLASGTTLALQPTEYLEYTHIYIGYVLKHLYILAGHVNWYSYYLIASLWLAHVALLYVILKRIPRLIFLFFYGIYFLICALYLLVVLQFTMVASMLGIAGMALVFFTNETSPLVNPAQVGSISWGSMIKRLTLQASTLSGIALLCLSFLIRYEATALAVLLFIPVLLIDLYASASKRICLLAKLPICIAGMALCYGAYSYNNHMYKQYGNYLEFNNLRGEFVDYSVAEEVPEEVKAAAFAKAGWSENDYTMMMNWFFMNEQLYNVDKFKLVLAELSPKWQGIPLSQLLSYQKYIMSFSIVLGCIVTSLLFLLFLRYSTIDMIKVGVAFLTTYLLMLLINYYFYETPVRVFYPMFVFGSILPLLVASRVNLIIPRVLLIKKNILILSLIMIFSAVIPTLAANSNYTKMAVINNKKLKEMIANFHFKQESLFVEWAGSFPYEAISPFDDPKLMKGFNFLSLGTGQLTPASKAMLAKFNITDIYIDLATKDNMYLIITSYKNDPSIELLNIYMQEHYQKSIKATPVYEFDKCLIVDIKFIQ